MSKHVAERIQAQRPWDSDIGRTWRSGTTDSLPEDVVEDAPVRAVQMRCDASGWPMAGMGPEK